MSFSGRADAVVREPSGSMQGQRKMSGGKSAHFFYIAPEIYHLRVNFLKNNSRWFPGLMHPGTYQSSYSSERYSAFPNCTCGRKHSKYRLFRGRFPRDSMSGIRNSYLVIEIHGALLTRVNYRGSLHLRSRMERVEM